MHLPRRHRRALLFPPGLLALAGLLWLGCMALSAHPEQLKRRGILQLTMLPFEGLQRPAYYSYEGKPDFLSSRAKINAFRPWYNINFSDDSLINRRQRANLIAAVRAISFDSAHDGGVRVHFMPTARYEDLVFTLDLMARENIKKYGLDIQHGPATFYAFTNAHLRPDSLECEGMVLPTPVVEQLRPISLRNQLHRWVADTWQLVWSEPLARADWKITMWLFAAITLLSGWRIGKSRKAA